MRTFNAIKACRTSILGGHKRSCKGCGSLKISYNSCRNRHCPKCQGIAKERWIKEREAELLNVPYFHIVFTLPSEFNQLALKHPSIVYNALFKASWQTIQKFSSDPAHLGAKIAMSAVLHTWGQNISLHPHLHCIVSGGGLNKKGKWVFAKKQNKAKRKANYLFPKRALSIVYRAKFMKELRLEITIPQSIAKQVMQKKWVVYAKQPFLGPKPVIEYLGRYTHKIAISNHRIQSINNKKISFKYKDYKSNAFDKSMTLDASEFIRRFSLHILPKGFRRMRHYGILASRNKTVELNIAKDYFGLEKWVKQKTSWEDIAREKLNINPNYCNTCKKDTLLITELIKPQRGPPYKDLKPNNEF